jgi:hypothetical protein
MSQENVKLVRGLWEPFKGVDCTTIDWDDEAIREWTERSWSPEVELKGVPRPACIGAGMA